MMNYNRSTFRGANDGFNGSNMFRARTFVMKRSNFTCENIKLVWCVQMCKA